MKRFALIASALLSMGLFSACTNAESKNNEHQNHQKMAADAKGSEAMVDIEPTKGNNARGHVHFTQLGNQVRVVADITGLTPNAKHGFHIHEGTECGDDGMKAGGHFNPDKHDHGLPNADKAKRHAGDMGNLMADAQGKAHLEVTLDSVTVGGEGANNIVGHTVIVHGKPDDGGQPTGNAGGRIGCGIIKAAK